MRKLLLLLALTGCGEDEAALHGFVQCDRDARPAVAECEPPCVGVPEETEPGCRATHPDFPEAEFNCFGSFEVDGVLGCCFETNSVLFVECE